MGNSGSTEVKQPGSSRPMGFGNGEGRNETINAENESGDKCPVDHKNMTKDEIKRIYGVSGQEIDRAENESADKCPVDHKKMTKDEIKKKMYDVYGQEIDPRNRMPVHGNELPSPGQTQRLSVERAQSTIPKSGSDGTWTYPSPQQFFNALNRKGKANDVEEDDMETVVQIHNKMNEKTWKEVLKWESYRHCECEDVKLKKFVGRPSDLSPTARMNTWMGRDPPFDRHDWTVDRCGKDVRYVIDYYYKDVQEDAGKDAERIHIHVRPALDSLESAYDRFMMKFSPPVGTPPSPGRTEPLADISGDPTLKESLTELKKQVSNAELDEQEFLALSALTSEKIRQISEEVGKKCDGLRQALEACEGEECEQVSVAANYCAASTICATQAESFMKAMADDDNAGVAYEKMTGCLERFHIMAQRVMAHHAGLVRIGPEQGGVGDSKPQTTGAGT